MAHPHSHPDLCETGRKTYVMALRTGRIARSAAKAAPCLLDLGFVRPDPDDARWLIAAPPTAVATQLYGHVERKVEEYLEFAITLADAAERFKGAADTEEYAGSVITVGRGQSELDINEVVMRALDDCTEELLTAQPLARRAKWVYREAVHQLLPLAERGVRMRTLYHHPARHHPGILDYLAQLEHADLEVRTLQENLERLVIIDRRVAFIPAQADRKVALEVRHPGLIWYLVTVFERFWQLAVPWGKEDPYGITSEGITGGQRTIAQLLVEGHLDEAIARRLGMNVRTCRAHIARLATTLGSSSRTQLGYLIARSGILEED